MANPGPIPHRSYLFTVLGCRCPRCREGDLFVHPVALSLNRNMEMHEHCPVCGQVTDIEVGFYYGTGYVSYLISILLTLLSLGLWWLVIGFSFSDRRFLLWVVINSFGLLCLQPYLMRFSRALWLSFFVSYDPAWRENAPTDYSERINKEQMGNW